MTSFLSHEKITHLCRPGRHENPNLFYLQGKDVAFLIFNKVMQSMFLAFYFRSNELFHHVLQVKQILLPYGLCSKRFEDMSQET